MRSVAVFLLVVGLATTFAPAAFADPRTEAAAKAAVKKAGADFVAMNYGTGANRVLKALKACGTAKCSAAVRASLMMDLGALQFKKGTKDDAARTWRDAAKLLPGAAFDPPFDGPDVRAAFTAATPPPPPAAPAGGDFFHSPPSEQTINTPLAIYVEGGDESVTHVEIRYKAESATSWKRLELKKMGDGWGGVIPCADVVAGALRYYVMGLDAAKTPVATSGDAKHPYVVQIKPSISGESPHLPGKPAPKSCSEPNAPECPPDFPGCSDKKKGAEATDDTKGATTEEAEGEEGKPAEAAKPAGAFRRFWVGVSGEFEFMGLPTGNDDCYLVPQFTPTGQTNPNAALPSNDGNLYCTTTDGKDFPTRANQTQNAALCTQAQVVNGTCHADGGGTSNGGLVPGDMRLMVSLDYAFTPNLLVGLRLGATLFSYPGQAAVTEGRAFGSRLYVEGRGTLVLGENAIATPGIKPMFFAGGGAAEFDGHTSSPVALQSPTVAGQPKPALVTGTVNIWRTNGPGFLTLGAGVWCAVSEWFAVTAALRGNGSFGVNGLVPTFGPELGVQLGF